MYYSYLGRNCHTRYLANPKNEALLLESFVREDMRSIPFYFAFSQFQLIEPQWHCPIISSLFINNHRLDSRQNAPIPELDVTGLI
jgi:hypothetical protein